MLVVRTRTIRRFAGRLLRASLLLWYVVLSTGVEISVAQPMAKKDPSGQPFPCQSRGCGCASAAQCWKSCCCFTAEQRLAWARAHDVQPPAELEAEVLQPAGSCCEAKRKHAPCCKPAAASAGKQESTGLQWLRALKCRSIDHSWMLAAPPCVVLPASRSPVLSATDRYFSRCELHQDSPHYAPPVPPPRAA